MHSSKLSSTWRLLSLVCLAAWGVSALEFEMQAQTKCIFEELNANVIVVGDYKAVNRDNPTVPIYIDLRVSTARLHGATTVGQLSRPWSPAGVSWLLPVPSMCR